MHDEDDRLLYWIWLNELRGIPLSSKRKLLQIFGEPKAIYDADISAVIDLLARKASTHYGSSSVAERTRGSELFTAWSKRDLREAETIMENHMNNGISTLCAADARYRHIFAADNKAPLLLYYRGKLASADSDVIGIIGTRSCTPYGRMVATAATEEAVTKGKVVASGLSFGIDAFAHKTALDHDGITYAFIPCGLHKVQPSSHTALAERIVENGAIISPYPYGKEALPFRFFGRNDLLACWCDTLLVVEARVKSGCMHTARSAMAKGKRVFAVPNSLLEPKSTGTNLLLAEGAIAYTNDRLSQEYKVVSGDTKPDGGNCGTTVLQALSAGGLATGEIAHALGSEIVPAMELLTSLELSDRVEYRADGRWHLVGGP